MVTAGVADRVEVRTGDLTEELDALADEGSFDVLTLDTGDAPEVVERADDLLASGGYLAVYSPFVGDPRGRPRRPRGRLSRASRRSKRFNGRWTSPTAAPALDRGRRPHRVPGVRSGAVVGTGATFFPIPPPRSVWSLRRSATALRIPTATTPPRSPSRSARPTTGSPTRSNRRLPVGPRSSPSASHLRFSPILAARAHKGRNMAGRLPAGRRRRARPGVRPRHRGRRGGRGESDRPSDGLGPDRRHRAGPVRVAGPNRRGRRTGRRIGRSLPRRRRNGSRPRAERFASGSRRRRPRPSICPREAACSQPPARRSTTGSRTTWRRCSTRSRTARSDGPEDHRPDAPRRAGGAPRPPAVGPAAVDRRRSRRGAPKASDRRWTGPHRRPASPRVARPDRGDQDARGRRSPAAPAPGGRRRAAPRDARRGAQRASRAVRAPGRRRRAGPTAARPRRAATGLGADAT